MAGEVFIAKESTSQAIKTQADSIKTVVDNIFNKPEPKVVFEKYSNINYSYTGTTSTYTEHLNIQGEGFLSFAVVSGSSVSTYCYVEVEIDGVTTSYSSNDSAKVAGVMTKEYVKSNSGNSLAAFNYAKGQVVVYALFSTASKILDIPIYFKNSLKIRGKSSDGTTQYQIQVIGGVKV